MTIRKAVSGDEDSILELIKELAVYEKEPNAVINTSQQLAKHHGQIPTRVCDCNNGRFRFRQILTGIRNSCPRPPTRTASGRNSSRETREHSGHRERRQDHHH